MHKMKWNRWVAIAVLGLLAVAPAASAGAAVEDSSGEDRVLITDSRFQTLPNGDGIAILTFDSNDGSYTQSSAGEVRCGITAHAPHKSNGAAGVIYKSTVSCNGYGTYPPVVTIQVNGGLFYDYAPYAGEDSDINFVKVKSSTEPRTVSVNGTPQTFYTPKIDEPGHRGMGHYQATSTIIITNPTGYKSGTHTSSVYWINALY